jgi:anti-sigma28 factor (negative regulator of flagellin synthesis)
MPAQQPMEARPVVPKDVVEISSTSSVSGKMEIEADFRAQRLAQIRQQIEDGSYETADKLDTAVDRLLEKLRSE